MNENERYKGNHKMCSSYKLWLHNKDYKPHACMLWLPNLLLVCGLIRVEAGLNWPIVGVATNWHDQPLNAAVILTTQCNNYQDFRSTDRDKIVIADKTFGIDRSEDAGVVCGWPSIPLRKKTKWKISWGTTDKIRNHCPNTDKFHRNVHLA